MTIRAYTAHRCTRKALTEVPIKCLFNRVAPFLPFKGTHLVWLSSYYCSGTLGTRIPERGHLFAKHLDHRFSFQNWLHARDSLWATNLLPFCSLPCLPRLKLLENLLTPPKRSRGVRRCGFPECDNISPPTAMRRNLSSEGFNPGFVVIADFF